MPILGVIASSISGNLYSASYDSIATTTVGAGGTSSITFSGIPSTYKHLQIRMVLKDSNGGTTATGSIQIAQAPLYLKFNSDSSASYSAHQILGTTTLAAYNVVSTGQLLVGAAFSNGQATTNSMFAAAIIDIFDYSNTNKFTTLRALSGVNLNGVASSNPAAVSLGSSVWVSTTTVNSIQLIPPANTFVQYTNVALYGIKG